MRARRNQPRPKGPGRTDSGKQQYHGRACNAYGTLNPGVGYAPERKAEILRAYEARTFGVARQTVAKWWRAEDAQLPALPPLEPAHTEDGLALDELWSFVGTKKTTGGSG